MLGRNADLKQRTMPKIKEFFTKLKEQGKIKAESWDKFLESDMQEVPDEAVKAFEDAFLTVDRAIGHAAVNGTIRSQILSPIDNDIRRIISILEPLDKDAAAEIEAQIINGNTPNTFKRMELITKNLPNLIEKVKTSSHAGDEDFKKKLADKDNIIREVTDRVSKVQAEKAQREKELEEGFNSRINQYILKAELEKLGSSYTLAEAYEQNRSGVNKLVMSEILAENKLQLGEKDGAYFIAVVDDKGSPRFDGNSPITVNSLLEAKYKPYLKQSNADGNGGQGTRTNHQTVIVQGDGKTQHKPRTTAVTMNRT